MNDSTEFRIILLLGALAMFFVFMGMNTKVVGEQLCVDGSHNINLEGIMCEESETTWFGLNMFFSFLSLAPFTIFTFWIVFKNENDN